MRRFFLSLVLIFSTYFSTLGQTSLNFTSKDRSYRQGVELLNQGKYVAASKAFEAYLAEGEDPVKRGDAAYFSAFCALQVRNKDGEAKIEQFIGDYPDHAKATLAYYELGVLKYNEKSYKLAIRYFEKLYLEKLPLDIQYDARFKLGYSYFTQREFDKAYEMFDQLKREENKYQYPSSYYAGYLNFEKGEYDRAFYDFERAEKNAAYAPVVPSMLVKVYYKQKRYDELLDYGKKALERRDVRDKSEINLYIGETYFHRKDYTNASTYYDEYLKSKKGNVDRDLLFRIAYVQMESQKPNEAIESFKKVALKNDTLGFIASYYLGNLYVTTDNKNFALSAYKVAKDNRYDEALEEESLFQYAKLNLDLENFAEAINAIDEYKRRYPGTQRVENIDEILTEAYLNSKNYDKALAYIEGLSYRSQRINRAYQQIAFFKGTELFNDGKFYQSVQLFDKSLQQPLVRDFVIKANYWKGEAYSIGAKYEEARDAYAAVFRADNERSTPEYLGARYGIGYAYFNLKSYPQALDHFKYFVDRASFEENKVKYRDALIRLGDCYYATKEYSRSLSTFDQAIEINRRLGDYGYFRKGVVYGVMGDLGKANENFDVVLNQYPESRHVPNTLYQKGQFNFENGSYTFAISLFSQLIDKFPESNYVPYALQSRAIAATNVQKISMAEADYKAILDKYPTHAVSNNALLGLQEILQQQGKTGEFDQYLAKFKNANPESDQLERIEFEAAKSQYFNQQYATAINSLERFMTSYPNSAQLTEATYLIADANYRMEQPEKALEQYYKIAPDVGFNRHNRVVQRIAELELAANNYEAATTYFKQLESIAATKKEQFAAWNGLMLAAYATENYQECIDYGKLILEKGQVTLNAQNEALLLIGKSSLAVGNTAEAIEYLERTEASAKDENGAEAAYLLARMLYESKDYQASIDKLFSLNSNFSIYERWLGKSFILIADNYLALEEDFQAKATLQSVIDNSPIEEIVDEAELKLLALEEQAAELENVELDTLEVEDIENK